MNHKILAEQAFNVKRKRKFSNNLINLNNNSNYLDKQNKWHLSNIKN